MEKKLEVEKNAVKEFMEEILKKQWLTVTVDKFVVCVEDIEEVFNRIYVE